MLSGLAKANERGLLWGDIFPPLTPLATNQEPLEMGHA